MLRQNDSGLNGVLEIPAFECLLPDLKGLTILDLGCGFGDFARAARRKGAVAITGVDISARMLAEARALTPDTAVTYIHSPIEAYESAPQAFDLVVSSLTLHYIDDYARVLHRVRRALKPQGHFVFSVEHPICTANPQGWICDAAGQRLHWPIDHYSEEGWRETRWFVDGVLKYHRTLQTYINTLLHAGFALEHLSEPLPTHEALAARPALYSECRRPPFLLLSARRP